MNLKTLLLSIVANDEDIAIAALKKRVVKINNVKLAPDTLFSWYIEHSTPLSQSVIANASDHTLWETYRNSKLNRKAILTEISKRDKLRNTFYYPLKVYLVDEAIKEYIKSICLDIESPGRLTELRHRLSNYNGKRIAKDSEFWLEILKERKSKRSKLTTHQTKLTTHQEIISKLTAYQKMGNSSKIQDFAKNITEQEWQSIKETWLSDTSPLLLYAAFVPFLTLEEVKTVWSAQGFCHKTVIQRGRLTGLTIPKDVLFSLPTDKVLNLIHLHLSEGSILQVLPKLDVADEVYLASLFGGDLVVESWLERVKQLKLIAQLEQVAKERLPRKIKLRKKDKVIVELILDRPIWLYGRIATLIKPADDLLCWWDNLKDKALKIAWARILRKSLGE